MANKPKVYAKPTAAQVESAVDKAARAARKASKMIGQFNGNTRIEPTAKQVAAGKAAGARLRELAAAKKGK